MLQYESGDSRFVDPDGVRHVNKQKFGTAFLECVDARIDTRFYVTALLLRSGKSDMSIPCKKSQAVIDSR